VSVLALPGRSGRRARRPNYRLRKVLIEAGSILLGIVVAVWSLIPVYNMLFIAFNPNGYDEFSGLLWPEHATLDAFIGLWNGGVDDVEFFWQQLGYSTYIGLAVMVLTVLVGSLASFAVSRLRLTREWMLNDIALLTYVIPSSTLVIPFYRIMHQYGLMENPWSVITAEVAFATPYAILVLQQAGKLIPIELDEAARIDGASVWQVYVKIYVPLMAPALAAVGTYALLFAWNDYLYQYLFLAAGEHTTVAVGLEQIFDDDDSPYNYMMAMSVVYSIPPVVIFYALRRYMASGLTRGGVKG
jgi:multiple sugar transport system permease protein